MTKKLIKLLLLAVVVFGVTEFFLRKYFGFCDAVLMQEDPNYEYIASPNQNRFRFRNHITYNSESMRSKEVNDSAYTILGFGDSIINGGSLTDQDSLATTILSDTLSKIYKKEIQFLNISAGSWGPDNCYAYLLNHGDFHAKSLFLFVNSHDSYDNMDFVKIVGIFKDFPDKQYKSAIYEVFARYVAPRIQRFFSNADAGTDFWGINKKRRDGKFNPGFQAFIDYAKINRIPLTLYLHAELSEFKKGSYNKYGQEIIRLADENNIRIIKDLDHGLQAGDFRDMIHLSDQGQRNLAMTVLKYGFE